MRSVRQRHHTRRPPATTGGFKLIVRQDREDAFRTARQIRRQSDDKWEWRTRVRKTRKKGDYGVYTKVQRRGRR